MTSKYARVDTGSLREVLTYLEGLVLIADAFQGAQGVGQVIAGELARRLLNLDAEDPICWDPLRYESAADGMGWEAVAVNVRQLREQLLPGYTEAAL